MGPTKIRPMYTSKSKRKECKTADCVNKRRQASAYCQECADKRMK